MSENQFTLNSSIKILLGISMGAVAIKTLQHFYEKRKRTIALKNDNISTSVREDGLVVRRDENGNPIQSTKNDFIILKTLRNFEPDGKTLCRGVYTSADEKIQFYRPIGKPAGYIEPTPKLFRMSVSENKAGNRPDYEETIDPISNPLGFIAKTEQERKDNIAKIALASGLTIDPTKDIDLSRILPSQSVIEYLASVVAFEATSPLVPNVNRFDLDRERIAILWCIVNRTVIGSTRVQMQKRTMETLKLVAKKAIAYDPLERLKTDKVGKDAISDCNLVFVKAFFFGFFNDETFGATHWSHFNPHLMTLPPLYFYPKGTKKRNSMEEFEAHLVRTGDKMNHYISNCVFVRVNEADANKDKTDTGSSPSPNNDNHSNTANKPSTNKPSTNKPSTNKPSTNKPSTNKPSPTAEKQPSIEDLF